MKNNLEEKLSLLPDKPGVYIMKNSSAEVIYVGKAKILKNRVRSYFRGKPADEKTATMVKQISDFDYIITNTEKEALILENNLIKKYKPHYNILLKDDKQYPFIKITTNEPFPRVFVTRKKDKDKARYFGPYTNVHSLRKVLKLLEWIFPHRTCTRKIPKDEIKYKNSCINYQMGKCPAPCIGKITTEEYAKTIKNIIRFLKGQNKEIIKNLKEEMQRKAEDLKFEEAANIRDKIFDIEKLNNSHHLYFEDEKNRDIIGFYKEGKYGTVTVLKILSGKLLNRETYPMQNIESEKEADILKAFLMQYYQDKNDEMPAKIIIQDYPADFEQLNQIFSNKLFVPQRGELKSLINIARKNAFNFVEEHKLKYLKKKNRAILPVIELKEKLNLKNLPLKMICIDISTIQGTDTVSSLVFFENGKPKKKNYRHFIIKSFYGQNDFAAIAETLERFLLKLDEENTPDLIVIDGGKGQLSSAYSVLKKHKKEHIPVISLAKRYEEIFVTYSSSPIILPKNSSALRLLIAIRDESHRFAITFHKKRRKKRTIATDLDKIKGIGEETKILLLKNFGSVKNIKKQTVENLMKIKGIGKKTAERVLRGLNED